MNRAELLAAVAAGRVTEQRVLAGPSAPSFYTYRYLLDGHLLVGASARALVLAVRDGDVQVGWGGTFGCGEQPVRVASRT